MEHKSFSRSFKLGLPIVTCKFRLVIMVDSPEGVVDLHSMAHIYVIDLAGISATEEGQVQFLEGRSSINRARDTPHHGINGERSQ